jgi:hypothetical protein
MSALTFESLNDKAKKVEKNRETIQRYLSSGLPIGIIKHNIVILSKQNERLLAIINSNINQ